MFLKLSRTNTISILSWLIAYFLLFYYVRSCSYNQQIGINLAVSAIDILCLLACSFFLRKIIIPKFLYKRKILKFLLSQMLLIVFFALLMQILHSIWYSITDNSSTDPETLFKHYYYQLFSCWWVTICGCLCIIAFRLIEDQWLTISRYNQLQKEKAQTELSFLKAQINPHFLFNSINSIFASIDKNNIEARSIVIKFSDMLRYQLYECNADQINFEKEFEYLNNYIELQRIRKDNNLTITTDLKGDMKGFTIAPLILIPFIENAFKYSSNHIDQPNVLQIIFTKEDDAFGFYCFNTKDQMISRKIFDEGGIGIQNVKRRLELIYPSRHELSINDNELFFEVRLKIEL